MSIQDVYRNLSADALAKLIKHRLYEENGTVLNEDQLLELSKHIETSVDQFANMVIESFVTPSEQNKQE